VINYKIIHSFLCQCGIYLLKFKNIKYIFKYLSDYLKFSKLSKTDLIFPILGEHKEKSSVVIKHYFNQDLFVACNNLRSLEIK
jgi:hypothetical protein